MRQLGGAGTKVPVQDVAKVLPFVGVNAVILGRVADAARRYCRNRFLCERYGLPLPAALDRENADGAGTGERQPVG